MGRPAPERGGDRSLDVQVGRRRGKLNHDAEEEGVIKTVRGPGDVFTEDPGAGRHAAIAMTPRLVLRGLRNALVGPVDLEVVAGEAVAVVGPSGAGKSVLLRMVADLDPHEGEALLDGVPCVDMPGPDWRRRVTYAAAEPGWWHERVGEHFAARPDTGRLLLRPDILESPVRLCSTGERQRLALLRALTGAPSVLLLDEPTAALDAGSTAAVEMLLAERRRAGLALLLVTHDPAQAERVGSRVLRLNGGRLRPA